MTSPLDANTLDAISTQIAENLHDIIEHKVLQDKQAFYNNENLQIEMYSDPEFVKSIQFKNPAVLQVCDKTVEIYSVHFDENFWATKRDTIFRFTYKTNDGAKIQLSDKSNEFDELLDGIYSLMQKTCTWSLKMYITAFYQSKCDNDEGYEFSTPNSDGTFTGTLMASVAD